MPRLPDREELFPNAVSDVVNKVVNHSSLGEIYSFAFTTRSQGGPCRTSELQFLFTRAVAGMWTLRMPLVFPWLSADKHVIRRVDAEVGTAPAP